MEFFCYHRDRPGSLELRDKLLEEHWSYMDRHAAGMIARGPTLTGDGEVPTGSVHIVDLPDLEAAQAFAVDEPNYRAGVYWPEVFLRRWRNELGRTMWDFPGGRTGGNRYLVLGHGTGTTAEPVPQDRESLIAFGPLLSDDGTKWLGTAALVRACDQDAARAVLTAHRYSEIEVHRWQFGGRQ
ncbi:MAG TPA: YciI family protein [Kineosporiaceae bacterium]|nr:YciI family protein [Kineosporiaceae bacterium]